MREHESPLVVVPSPALWSRSDSPAARRYGVRLGVVFAVAVEELSQVDAPLAVAKLGDGVTKGGAERDASHAGKDQAANPCPHAARQPEREEGPLFHDRAHARKPRSALPRRLCAGAMALGAVRALAWLAGHAGRECTAHASAHRGAQICHGVGGNAACKTARVPRAIWNGSVNFGLVTIPVKLYPAIADASRLHFHLLHGKDMGRIKNQRVCSDGEHVVPWNEVVRGYEYAKGEYVVVTDEDLKAASPEATQSVQITEFVKASEVDPMLLDTPYYLEPDRKGRHAYALLREALRASGRVAIASVVLRTREHAAMVRPEGKALILELLRYPEEIVDAKTLEFPEGSLDEMPAAEMKAASMLIDAMTKKFDSTELHDRYEEKLREELEARARGATPRAKGEAKPARGEVVNLLDILEKSLRASKTEERGPKGPKKAGGGPKHPRKRAA